jgi:sporulation protein YlmC with PRC-barrel domain
MRQIRIFTPKKEKVDLSERIKEVIGKKILGKNGEVIGRVKDIVASDDAIEGILVRRKFTTLFIDLEYVDDLHGESVLLKIDPAIRYIGMHVFDSEGRKIGKVTDIVQKQKTNIIESIIVKKYFFSKPLEISVIDIDVSQKNIILKIAYG